MYTAHLHLRTMNGSFRRNMKAKIIFVAINRDFQFHIQFEVFPSIYIYYTTEQYSCRHLNFKCYKDLSEKASVCCHTTSVMYIR